MMTHDTAGPGSPLQQAGRLAFLALYVVTLLAALGWTLSNVRQIGPENRVVVLRLGALHRIQNAGLLLAWPRPLEQVVILPSPDRVMEHRVAALLRSQQALQADSSASKENPVSDALAGSGYLLTGDAGVVQLDVRVFYRVVDPYDYVLQRDHITPALERLVTRSAVTVCAARDLDTILVARPELVGASSHEAERRERLRGDLVHGINQGLAALKTAGTGLGIDVVRVDVQASLPREAVSAFNAVLTASQTAEQNVARARTEAAQLTQTATQAADRTLQVARAQASERLAKAQADTATVLRLAQAMQDNVDPGLLLRLYRERIAAILSKAGAVVTVDPRDDARLIIPGAE
jgi:regulator of protease activity HflC (stomatin/prohibitin superfamily)